MGVFINALPLRNAPKGDKTFNQFLLEVRDNALEAYAHQEYPFEELVDKLGLSRDISRNPLFDTMLVLQNHDQADLVRTYALPDIHFGYYSDLGVQVAKFDLTLTAVEIDNYIHVSLEYCADLFREETIHAFRRYYVQIMKQVLDHPDILISDIDVLDQEERRKTVSSINQNRQHQTGFDL